MPSNPVKKPSLPGVLLISPPWPLYNRPSIQLGTLKAYLTSRFNAVHVFSLHAYLKIAHAVGYPIYQAISERTRLSETVYAALLFPEKRRDAGALFRRLCTEKNVLKKIEFDAIVEKTRLSTEEILDGISYQAIDMVGISVCLCQISAAFYFSRQIKKRSPGLPIVLGGSSFSGQSGDALFSFFPEIDFLVHGEGELPLSRLVEQMIQKGLQGPVAPMKGVSQKGIPESRVEFEQVKSLGELPVPDYDDYFTLLGTMDPESRFFPTLPVETSRGCWWHRSTSDELGNRRGCAFCNLNLQWRGYRSKDPLKAAGEVDQLTSKHRVLSVACTDNIVSPRQPKIFFESLSKQGKGYHLFCEIRADTSLDLLERMHHAGVREVQIGIEALSTRLLERLNKGTTALQNLEIMKRCESLGITSISNLILYFPGSDIGDVEETLQFLNFAQPFRPLRTVAFWLGRGSPVWSVPEAFGIRKIYNHPDFNKIFPKPIAEKLPFVLQGYRGNISLQKRLWHPVKERARQWQKAYAKLHAFPGAGPILSYSDGREFIIIRQRRIGALPMNHRLVGMSMQIYLFCDRIRSLKEIVDHFKGISEERVAAFLRMMVEKRLMASENNSYLSLAIPIGIDCDKEHLTN